MEAKDLIDSILACDGWTQLRIEERTGIPQGTISKVARGVVKDMLSRNYRQLLALYEEVVLQKVA